MSSTTSYNNTLQGTPRSNTDPIDYERIINNAYDPDVSHSDSGQTATVITDTSNPHQEDVANNHNDIEDDIGDFFQNQDLLQAQEGEVSSLNAEAEAEYVDTDQYLREGQVYEIERRQSINQKSMEEISEDDKDEHSIFGQMRSMMAQVTMDKDTITNLAKQIAANKVIITDLYNKIEKQSISVQLDKTATTQMRTQVLAAQANIERLATMITEKTS